jgi:hypothetical protein
MELRTKNIFTSIGIYIFLIVSLFVLLMTNESAFRFFLQALPLLLLMIFIVFCIAVLSLGNEHK